MLKRVRNRNKIISKFSFLFKRGLSFTLFPPAADPIFLNKADEKLVDRELRRKKGGGGVLGC